MARGRGQQEVMGHGCEEMCVCGLGGDGIQRGQIVRGEQRLIHRDDSRVHALGLLGLSEAGQGNANVLRAAHRQDAHVATPLGRAHAVPPPAGLWCSRYRSRPFTSTPASAAAERPLRLGCACPLELLDAK